MRYTSLLLPGQEPGVFVAFVPTLDVVTQGEGIEGAIEAAREAAILTIRGMIAAGENVPVEPAGSLVASLDIPDPVEAAVA